MAGYCRDCFTGTVQHDAVPSGSEQNLHGLPTYVTAPEPGIKPLGTVIIIPDAFGWRFPNTRSLADAYARRVPCTVYIPDFMNGSALPEQVMALMEYQPPANDFIALRLIKRVWSILQVVPPLIRFAIACRHSVAQSRMHAFLGAVRTSATTPPPKVGVAGFCWGGRYAVELTHDTRSNKISVGGKQVPLIDCAFTAHPSLLTIPRDIENALLPLSVANGDNDSFMGRENLAKLKQTLQGKNEELGSELHEVVVYPGAEHGFAIRRDWNDQLQKDCRDKCEDQAVSWFRRYFV